MLEELRAERDKVGHRDRESEKRQRNRSLSIQCLKIEVLNAKNIIV